MELSVRPLITAGVALIGAGLITAPPMANSLPDIPAPAVQLAAESDFFTLWADVLDRSFTNLTALGTELLSPPVPILQQILANQIGFWQDFLQNPSDIWNIFGQMWSNLVAGVSAPFEQPNLDALDTLQTVAYAALSGLMGQILPADPELGQWVLDFSTTPLSGWIWGEVGTFVSPWIELSRSIQDTLDSIRDNDWSGMVNDILNIPAHMLDGYLNGAGELDLTSLVQELDLPPGIVIRGLGIDLPGLLSAGGTIFGSIDADVCAGAIVLGRCVGVPVSLTGSGSGPLGSLINISHNIAEALGWSGTGNPIGAVTDTASVLDATPDLSAGNDAFGALWQDLLNAVGL